MYYRAEKHSSSLFDQSILIVDDAAINRDLIAGYLRSAGYKDIRVAVDGEDALSKIKENEPDILILDLVMPKLDGTEVIKELRANPKTHQLPILVQTAISDPEQRTDAWKYGANDIITKPIHKLELLSRVKVHLENSFFIKELENYQQTADQEITKALELQRSLLPSPKMIQEVEKKYGLGIDYLYFPSRFLSGDIWGMHELPDNKLLVWICDFSGKGLSASLYTLRFHTLLQEIQTQLSDPHAIIQKLNEKLVDMVQVGNFCTLLVGVVDLNTNTFNYFSGSATHPFIFNEKTNKYDLGDGTGMPLGISKETIYEPRSLTFEPGDSLILYSDLLWEDEGGIPGVSFLSEEIGSFFENLKGQKILEAIRRRIEETGETNFSDDLTLIEIEFSKPN